MFQTQLQQLQFLDKYARWNETENRRETWQEAVSRVVSHLRWLSWEILPPGDYQDIHDAIADLQVLPSMRLLAMSGEAARRNEISGYNCASVAIDSFDALPEILFILMAGTGVGFSVEDRCISQLPAIEGWEGGGADIHFYEIQDSAEGWAKALEFGLSKWVIGQDAAFDYRKIRPAGSRLRTKGGTASGSEPLRKLLDFARATIMDANGRKLTSLEIHDICCMIGDCVISGGVRRSSLLSLFDATDEEMLSCKNGDLTGREYRYNANNSAVWEHPLSRDKISDFFRIMDDGQRGEPGIFSRYGARITLPERRNDWEWGTNPCGEIVLRHTNPLGGGQFCNLSSVVARENDTLETLMRKTRIATIIGTIQAKATDFPFLRPGWAQNCREERILGVDITGQMDCPIVRSPVVLQAMRETARQTNRIYADLLGINRAAAITCTKPSGNSSILADCSPGFHARHAPYYIRRIRLGSHSPITKLLQMCNYPLSPENGQNRDSATTWVAEFPVKSPDRAIVKGNLTAMEQLEQWLIVKENWAEHQVSATITYHPDELEKIISWVHDNQEELGGLSFLPFSNARYKQMPYEEIDEERYIEMVSSLPKIDFDLLPLIEYTDMTTGSQQLACVPGQDDC